MAKPTSNWRLTAKLPSTVPGASAPGTRPCGSWCEGSRWVRHVAGRPAASWRFHGVHGGDPGKFGIPQGVPANDLLIFAAGDQNFHMICYGLLQLGQTSTTICNHAMANHFVAGYHHCPSLHLVICPSQVPRYKDQLQLQICGFRPCDAKPGWLWPVAMAQEMMVK